MQAEESLRHAAMFGDAETVERLLLNGADINAADERGRTALLRATSQRHFSLARLLIERGADVNRVDKRGRSPLHWVAQQGSVELASLLLAKGAQANLADFNGKIPLRQAITNRANDIAQLLLQNTVWNPVTRNYYLYESLCLAIDQRNFRGTKRLVEAGVSLDVGWRDGPLLLAARNQNEEIARLLLDHGANPTAKTEDRRSALTECLSHPLPDKQVNPVLNLLLRRGATIGLEEAVVVGDAVYARGILEQGGADVEMPDARGQTLLMWAVTYGNPAIIRLLIEYGAAINRTDNHHQTPLMKAAERGDLVTVQYLLSRGADARQRAGRGQWTAFDFAASQGHLETAAWLFERFGFGPRRGADVLALAADRGYLSIVIFLLDRGADPNTETVYLYGTAFLRAGLRGHTEIAQLLMTRGVSVNQRDKNGVTALACAAAAGNKRMVRWLLAQGADKKSIESAIEDAGRAGREYIAAILREALAAFPAPA